MGVIRETEPGLPAPPRGLRPHANSGQLEPIRNTGLAAGVLFLCASWSLRPRPSAAADKVDVITFKNGDRLTCEIKRLERGTPRSQHRSAGDGATCTGER